MKIGIEISYKQLNNASQGTNFRGSLDGFNQVDPPIKLLYLDLGQVKDDSKPKTIRTHANTLYSNEEQFNNFASVLVLQLSRIEITQC